MDDAGNWYPESAEDFRAWGVAAAKQLELQFTKYLLPLSRAAAHDVPKLAHLFVAMRSVWTEFEKAVKVFNSEYDRIKGSALPDAFEQSGTKSYSTTDGHRVTVSVNLRASIRADEKEAAYEWLRDHHLGDLITLTINAGTLAAAGKHMLEEGQELPDNLFNTFYQNTVSVTKTRNGK